MDTLLEVKDLTVEFSTEEGTVRAVDHVSFSISRGEILGLVGESGAGKSLTSEAILRLIKCPPGHISGEVFYKGVNLLDLKDVEMSAIRGKDIAMIFQDPKASLNPVFRVGEQLLEAMVLHLSEPKRTLRQRVIELFQKVGIPSPEHRTLDYPHQFSGGMSQRVMIGTSISCTPSLLIADEPTTALDVTIQAQILYLIRRLADETQASILLVSHDLGIISQMCHQVIVMYAGKIVEQASVQTIFRTPSHPYTRGLIASIPQLDTDQERLGAIPGVMPGLLDIPSGCPFHPRCEIMEQRCQVEEPALRSLGPKHLVACHKV
jgi:peptide/nickel transport system ATP-binding protein/oligopeptide transport system ATP-binding protein